MGLYLEEACNLEWRSAELTKKRKLIAKPLEVIAALRSCARSLRCSLLGPQNVVPVPGSIVATCASRPSIMSRFGARATKSYGLIKAYSYSHGSEKSIFLYANMRKNRFSDEYPLVVKVRWESDAGILLV
jgi:hypothetical protein